MTVKPGYVTDGEGTYYVQTLADNAWGFSIHDDDQSWSGGFGAFGNRPFYIVPESEVPDEDRDRLCWIFE